MFLTEILGVAFNLAFIALLIRRHIACWAFGIAGSGVGVYNFILVGLFSEALLFSFYILMGIYGWWVWNRSDSKKAKRIIQVPVSSHLIGILLGILGTALLGWFFKKYTSAALPWPDAFSTSFSIVATWMEAHRVLAGWFYWIILNAFSIWLYSSRGLNLYSALAGIYAIMSVYGYLRWRADFIKLEERPL
jgi:nicotinamide mononucleotide transporter